MSGLRLRGANCVGRIALQLTLTCLLFLPLAGRPANGADLIVGARTEPGSLDPHYMWGQITTQFTYHYLGFMTRKGPDGSLSRALA